MSDPDSPQVRDATAPFDDHRRADVILRSSDLVDFHVYKLILSLASPVFDTMFTLPTTPSTDIAVEDDDDDHRHGLPVIKLTEDSCTLDAILRACYPNMGPRLESLDSVAHVLQVAEKYDVAACYELARGVVANFTESQPIRAYAVACRYGFKDAAVRAAWACLKMTFDSLIKARPPELTTINVSQYQNLLQYHRDCGQAVARVTTTLDWLDDDCDGMTSKTWVCSCTTSRSKAKYSGPYAPPYAWAYLARAGVALKEHPVALVVFQASVFTSPEHIRCGPNCYGDKTKGMVKFVRLLADTVNTALDKVRVSFALEILVEMNYECPRMLMCIFSQCPDIEL